MALVNSCAAVVAIESGVVNSAVDSSAIESDCIGIDQCYAAAVVVAGMMASLVSVYYIVMEALATGFDSGKAIQRSLIE